MNGPLRVQRCTCRRTTRTVRPSTGLPRESTGLLRRARALSGRAGGSRVATHVAFVIAVADARRELSQVALADRLAAHRTEGLRLGCPAIHQHELHCPPPNEKQNTVSAASPWALGGGAQRWFLPSGLSRLRSIFC